MVTSSPQRTIPAISFERRELLQPTLGAAIFILIALVSTGGDLTVAPNQVPTTWVDVVLILAGATAAGALMIRRGGGSGSLSFWLFAAVAALTALSIAWSILPDQSWEESGRTLAYLAVFGVGIALARLGAGTSRNAVLAITLGASGLCLWALAVKVFDLNLYTQPDYGRLVSPTQYWNTTGLTGALALPGLVWLAARRGGAAVARGLGCAGIAIAATVVALSYSRSAVAAALLATILPLFFIRARRRAVVMLLLGLAGAVPICADALSVHAISADASSSLYSAGRGPDLHRTSAELVLGAIILAVGVLLILVGALISRHLDRTPQPAGRLRLFDRAQIGAIGAVPVLVVLWLVFNSRGPGGEISHLWNTLVASHGKVGDQADRLLNVANSRSAYYRQAFTVGEHHLLFGAGAGAFKTAVLPYPIAKLTSPPMHAHSYVMETFADFGLVGIVLNLALFCAWCRDGVRAAGRRAAASSIELDARWALLGVVIAFGVSSAIDWTWFFPAVAVPALFAAGWIAGVGGQGAGVRARHVAAGPTRPAATPPRPLSTRPGAILALTVLAIVTLVACWYSLQPMRSTQSTSAALNNQGVNSAAALADARAGVSEDPLSADALIRLANIDSSLGAYGPAEAAYEKAVKVQSQNPDTWNALGNYQLCVGQYDRSIRSLERAVALDMTDSDTQAIELATAKMRVHANYCDGLK